MAIEQLAEEVVNEVATNFEEAAEVTRKINAAGLGYFTVGLRVGAAIGFYFGYKFSREKIRAEAFKEAEAEIHILRQVYLDKTLMAKEEGETLQGTVSTEKPPIEEVVENLGYRTQVPKRERPLPAPVPILDDPLEVMEEASKSASERWNYERELENRSPDSPYIIHQNEWTHSNLNYTKAAYTYYDGDDMLVNNENMEPVPFGERVVGEANLRFGHGSDNEDVVYIRNDRLELDVEICRINRSYEEDVLGLGSHGSGIVEDDDDDDDDDDS